MGILQAILQVMLWGAGPVGYCPKVLKGIISAGYYTCCLLSVLFLDVLFLDPYSWIFCLLLIGCFVLGHCAYCLLGVLFLDIVLVPYWAFCS